MQGTKAAVKETSREMPHILVVDDEKSIGELLEDYLRKEGHRVEVVHSVEAAKRKLESRSRHHHFGCPYAWGEWSGSPKNSPRKSRRVHSSC